jgi:flavorubredoxin
MNPADMKNTFKAVPVTDRVYWVGAIDWTVRDFHGYRTGRGTTYNAYLIMADKVTLMDTVKAPFRDELLARVASVIDPADVQLIISNHAEPDHSGSLPEVAAAIRPEKIYASKTGVKSLEANLHAGVKVEAVEDMQEISLGDMKVTAAETKMCHWPDSMVSYLHEEKMLISQDAFGMHLASYERFDDQLDPAVLDEEAAKYYANILLPFSNFINKALDKLTSDGFEMKMIAPDHGPIWRKNPAKIVGDYRRWASQKRNNKAVVVYDTMWQTTDKLARAVGEGLAAGGASPKVLPMGSSHRSDVATEILDAGALIVGAPTINNQMFPSMADVMSYIKGLRPQGLVGGVFGSYGWGGESTKQLRAILEEMKVEIVDEPVRVNYRPTGDDLQSAYQLGLAVAKKIVGGQ